MDKNILIKELKHKLDTKEITREKLLEEIFYNGKFIDLSNLEFRKNIDIDFTCLKTLGNIYNLGQQARNIDNSKQVGNTKILNVGQMSIAGNIVNDDQKASYISNHKQYSRTENVSYVTKELKRK